MKALSDIFKWTVLICIGGIVFYVVYPKWEFHHNNPRFVLNKITGTLVRAKLVNEENVHFMGLWVDKRDFFKKAFDDAGVPQETKDDKKGFILLDPD